MAPSNSLSPIDVSIITDRNDSSRLIGEISPFDREIERLASLEGEPNILTESEVRAELSSLTSNRDFELSFDPVERFHTLVKKRADEIGKKRILKGAMAMIIGSLFVGVLTRFKDTGGYTPPGAAELPIVESTSASSSTLGQFFRRKLTTILWFGAGLAALAGVCYLYSQIPNTEE